jgi:hypothetical protein
MLLLHHSLAAGPATVQSLFSGAAPKLELKRNQTPSSNKSLGHFKSTSIYYCKYLYSLGYLYLIFIKDIAPEN